MKKYLSTILSLFLFTFALAQDKVDITIKAGGLESAISGKTNIKELIIKGTIDASDFKAITSHSRTLTKLDISGITKIESYRGSKGTAGQYDLNEYPEDEFPRNFHSYGSFTSLEELILPMGNVIKSMGDYSLGTTYQQHKIKSIKLPSGVKKIGNNAFALNYSLEHILFENDNQLETIGDGAFQYCSSLETINLPKTVKTIGNYAFQNTEKLSVELAFPALELFGGQGTFESSKIKKFEIPHTTQLKPVTGWSIPFSSTFKNSDITSFKIPDGWTEIGVETFQYANKLTYLEIPSSIKTINKNALSASSLNTIKVFWDFPLNMSEYNGTTPGSSGRKLMVPRGTKALYEVADFWKNFEVTEFDLIERQEQTIENFSDSTVYNDDPPLIFSARSTSKLPLTYTMEKEKNSIAKLEGNVLTFLGTGTVKITATQEGNDVFKSVEKVITINITAPPVIDYSWLESATITIERNKAKVAGPGSEKFTKLYLSGTAVEGNFIDISEYKGEIDLKATTSDGSEVIKLKINKQ